MEDTWILGFFAITTAEGTTTTTDSDRHSQQREAVYRSWAKTEDWSARTAKARAARDAKRLAAAGGDPKRAEAARKAELIAVGRKSAALRKAAAQARREASEE